MLKSRYEEYSNIFNDLPCVFTKNIKRSKFNYSKNTNWHENLEIEFCNDGQGYVLLDGKNFNFSKGNIAIINSNVIHYTSTDTYLNYDCLIIDTKFCKRAGIDPRNLSFQTLIEDENIKRIFLKLKELYKKTDNPCFIAKLQSLILEMLIILREKYTLNQISTQISTHQFENIKKLYNIFVKIMIKKSHSTLFQKMFFVINSVFQKNSK